ncbi:MAG: hypothetical protein MJ171_06395, partial [Clostridia bacterium]|nr:hypothetical protein [Clostridia bacterium]
MKKALAICLVFIMLLSLCACGTPKCEHANLSTRYEMGILNVNKFVSCADCGKEIGKGSISSLNYVYNKELLNENG